MTLIEWCRVADDGDGGGGSGYERKEELVCVQAACGESSVGK